MGDQSISDLLYATDDQTAQQRASALAAALRGQQQQAQRMQFQGNLGAAFDNPVLAAVGKAYATTGTNSYADAQRQLEEIPSVSEKRMLLTREKAKDASQEAYQKGELANRNQQLADERAFHKAQLEQSKFAPLQQGGRTYNTKTGELGEAEGAPKPPPGGAKANDPDKALATLRGDIDPSSGRGAGLFGKDQGLVTSADKVLALIDDGKGGRNYNLTVRQMPELVQSVAGMLSSGNQAAQAQLEHLMPHTAGMSLAQKLEYLSGSPEIANAGDFVKQYAETADREKKLAQKRIRDVQLRRLPAHAGLYGAHPEESKALVRQYLPDLNDDQLESAFKGTYKDAPAAPMAGALPADKAKRLAELRALQARGELK